MGMRVAEGRNRRTKLGAKLLSFSDDVAKSKARVEDYSRGSGVHDGGVLLEAAIADLRAQNEELLVADEELRVQSEEIVRSQRRMEVERRRYRDLFDLSPDAQFVTDRHGTIQEANTAATTLVAIEARFLRGKPLSTFVRNDDSKAFLEALNDLQRKHTVEVDLTLTARGDAKTRVAFRGARMNDPLFYVWSARPSGGAVAADSAHEKNAAPGHAGVLFNNPAEELTGALSSILALTKALRAADLTGEVRERGLTAIERHAIRQAETVETLFELSCAVTGNLTLSRAPVDLADVVSLAIESLRPEALAHDAVVAASIDGPVQILGDPLRLEQLVCQLLASTLHRARGRSVEVRLSRVDHHAELSVSDSHDGGQSPDGGLGFYIVRALTEVHRGTASLERTPGVPGVTFRVRLPVLDG